MKKKLTKLTSLDFIISEKNYVHGKTQIRNGNWLEAGEYEVKEVVVLDDEEIELFLRNSGWNYDELHHRKLKIYVVKEGDEK